MQRELDGSSRLEAGVLPVDRDFDCGSDRNPGKLKDDLTFTGWSRACQCNQSSDRSPTNKRPERPWLHGSRVCDLLSVAVEHLLTKGIIREYQTGGDQLRGEQECIARVSCVQVLANVYGEGHVGPCESRARME